MKIFAIDDEKAMLDALHEAIVAAEPDAEVLDFKRAKPALAAIEETGAPDVVFSDIELPGIDGISLATKIKDAAPDAKIASDRRRSASGDDGRERIDNVRSITVIIGKPLLNKWFDADKK